MLKNGFIKLSHAIPPADQLKNHAYCKWHNSFSHATNDCNVFRRQVQSAINEGRLVLAEMQVDKAPFPVHTLNLNTKVLIRPEQADGAKGKNVVIGDPRPEKVDDKIPVRTVMIGRTLDGKESLKITINTSRPGGQESSSEENRSVDQAKPVRPVSQTGQTGLPLDRPRTFKPKRPEVGTWKVNEPKVQGTVLKQGPTFSQLLNKYTKAVQGDRPVKKRPRSPMRGDGYPENNRHRGDVVTVYPPQKMYVTMPWAPPASNSPYPTWDQGMWMQCFPMPQPPQDYMGNGPRIPVHDRLSSYQSDPALASKAVRPVSKPVRPVLAVRPV